MEGEVAIARHHWNETGVPTSATVEAHRRLLERMYGAEAAAEMLRLFPPADSDDPDFPEGETEVALVKPPTKPSARRR